jgi:hypothetical protein
VRSIEPRSIASRSIASRSIASRSIASRSIASRSIASENNVFINSLSRTVEVFYQGEQVRVLSELSRKLDIQSVGSVP